ncbi:MAG: FKBP-type peptidyl-prolyl cis-trans isomerase [Alphaproteobacteria bacterium]|nr:FKBP-type peptidyl-prolyl cis-trans isomerase [Alphaproteobacteria bacterium]
MFPFRSKTEKRKPPPKPAWLKWLMIGFIVYALAMAGLPNKNPTKQTIDKAKQNVLQHETVDFSGYESKLFPQDPAALRIDDVHEGSGDPAVCGQRVRLAYETFLAQGNALPDKAGKDKPLSFTIGDGHVMPVFDRGVVGMKPGGKRSIIAPPLMSYGMEDYKRDDVPDGAMVRFEIELLSASPPIPDVAVMPYRIAEVAVGNGAMLVCGQPASLRVKLWDTSGKLLYSNHEDKVPLAITPGKSEVMLGLEQGVLGMLEGGTRLLIIPPAFQRTMSGTPAKFPFPLPKDQTVLVEVEAHTGI